jgi:imidazolonepropionase-like amidohydrolase
VNSIEHGDGLTDSLMDVMVKNNVYWVPTVTVGVHVVDRGGVWPALVALERRNFGRALKKGVKIVLGTDVGGFPWTEINQAKELEYYVQYGMTPMQAIQSGPRLPPPCWARSRASDDRAGLLCGHRRGFRRSHAGHHGTATGQVRYEGWHGLP